MKRIISTLTAAGLLAGALLLPAGLRAEGKEPRGEKGGKEAFMERMREKFGITEEQEAKLKAARRARRDGDAAAHEQAAAAMRKLEDQLEDKAPESDISATLDKILAARKTMRSEEDKFEAALASILSPTQRAKMLLAMKAHGGMHGGKPGGGMGGGKGEGKRD